VSENVNVPDLPDDLRHLILLDDQEVMELDAKLAQVVAASGVELDAEQLDNLTQRGRVEYELAILGMKWSAQRAAGRIDDQTWTTLLAWAKQRRERYGL
jgi:hypothetical protein